MGEQAGKLVVCASEHTSLYDQDDKLVRDVSSYYAKHAILDSRDGLWYADPVSGLVKITDNWFRQILSVRTGRLSAQPETWMQNRANCGLAGELRQPNGQVTVLMNLLTDTGKAIIIIQIPEWKDF